MKVPYPCIQQGKQILGTVTKLLNYEYMVNVLSASNCLIQPVNNYFLPLTHFFIFLKSN